MATERRSVPLLALPDVEKAIEWYRKAFLAVERHRTENTAGRVAMAQLEMLGTEVTLSEADCPNVPLVRATIGNCFVPRVVVEDADAICHNASMYGALILSKMELRLDGYRSAALEDPFGYRWIIASEAEYLDRDGVMWPEEEARRWVNKRRWPSTPRPR